MSAWYQSSLISQVEAGRFAQVADILMPDSGQQPAGGKLPDQVILDTGLLQWR